MTISFGNRLFAQSLRSVIPVTLTLWSASLSGQTTTSKPQSSTVSEDGKIIMEKVVVTGSAIPVVRDETFSPVKLFQDEDFARIGTGTVIEAIRTLPGVYGDMSSELKSNGGSGQAGVNFRGLGGTLSLLDGHRTAGFSEYNLLPRVAVQYTDVLKDGAGARYGSDALAGVFNVSLVPSFQGSKLEVYYGNTTDTDAGVARLDALAGIRSGGTEIVVAAEYYHRNALMARDREVSANGDGRSRGGINTNTAAFSGRTTGRRSVSGPVEDLVLAPGVTAPFSTADYVPIDTNANTSQQLYNLRSLTPSIPEQTNRSFYGRINQDILGERLEAFVRILYAHGVFDSAVTPTSLSVARSLAVLSPHVPSGLVITGSGNSAGGSAIGTTPIRANSLGNRGRYYDRSTYDVLAGLKGRIGDTWSWEASYIMSVWDREDVQNGALSATALRAIILNGSYNLFALDSAKGVNPNNGIAFDNPAALASAGREARVKYEYDVRGGDVRVNGSLYTLPAGDIQIGFGGEYFRTDQNTMPDAFMASGDLQGIISSSPSIARSFATGGYAELLVPLVSKSNKLPLVASLELSLSGRIDRQRVEGYLNSGTTGDLKERAFDSTNSKFGIRYRPCEDVLLRGTWGTGFRVPFLFYMFAGNGTSNPALQDPLGYSIGNTTPITTSGNINLNPEESTTWSTGIVYMPKGIRGLKVSLDYYYGQIEGLVGEGAQFMINANAQSQGAGYVAGNPATFNPNALFAQNITRNAGGSITGVKSTYLNVAERETTGLDYGVSYVWPWQSAGRWSTYFDWNTTLSWDLTLAKGLPSRNQLGKFGDIGTDPTSPGSIPRNRGYINQVWEKGAWQIAGAINYISHLEDELSRTFGTATDGSGNTIFVRKPRYVAEWVTADAQVKYVFTKIGGGMEKFSIRVGCLNVTDEPAPFAAGAFNDSYDQVMHSNRGRFVYTNLVLEF